MDLPTTMVDIDGQEWIVEMVNNIIIEVLSSIAEQERKTTKQRQKEGIEAAHKKGKHLGRPKVTFPDNWQENYDIWRSGQITATEAMSRMGLTRSSFYKLVKIYQNK